MHYLYSLSGGKQVIKEYAVGEAFTVAGIPVEAPATTEAGVMNPTSVAAVTDCMGFSLDTATYSTAQTTDGSDAASLMKVIVNPDAVMGCRLAGGATTGTDLSAFTVDTANAAGTSIETTSAATNFLDGTIWGLTGANAGLKRKITAVSGNHFTVVVPFHDIAVGDTFAVYPGGPGHINGTARNQIQLTTDFAEADASAAWTAEADLAIVDADLYDDGGEGRLRSRIHIMSSDHVFAGVLT